MDGIPPLVQHIVMLGIGQCLFVALVLGTSARHADPADRWLAAGLVINSVMAGLDLAEERVPNSLLSATVVVNLLLNLLIAPAIYGHLAHVLGFAPGFHAARRRHLLVPAAGLALAVPGLAGPLWPLYATLGVGYAQQGAYLVLAFRRLRGASPDGVRQRWTLRILAVLAVCWLVSVGAAALALTGVMDHSVGWWSAVVNVAGFFLVGLLAFERPRQTVAAAEALVEEVVQKYRRSGLQPGEGDLIALRLQRALAQPATLTDSTLSLAGLAKQLGTSPHLLSQVCNQQLGQSLPELLAAARVHLARQRLADPARAGETVLEIAMGCGFSSKSAFNAAFRRHAGATPSAWRQQALEGVDSSDSKMLDVPADRAGRA